MSETFKNKALQIAGIILEEEDAVVSEITLPILVKHLHKIEEAVPDVMQNWDELVPQLSEVTPRLMKCYDKKIEQYHRCFIKSSKPLNPCLAIIECEIKPIVRQTNFYNKKKPKDLMQLILVDHTTIIKSTEALISAYTLLLSKLSRISKTMELKLERKNTTLKCLQIRLDTLRLLIEDSTDQTVKQIVNCKKLETSIQGARASTKLQALQCRQLTETVVRVTQEHANLIHYHLELITGHDCVASLIHYHNLLFQQYPYLKTMSKELERIHPTHLL